MPTVPQLAQQLQQDIQNELVSANQVNQLILEELHEIRRFTDSRGEFARNIEQNALLISKLANLQKIDIDSIPETQRNITENRT